MACIATSALCRQRVDIHHGSVTIFVVHCYCIYEDQLRKTHIMELSQCHFSLTIYLVGEQNHMPAGADKKCI